MTDDHYFPAADDPCSRCGVTFGHWIRTRARCRGGEALLTPPESWVWRCVVQTARGTNAADPAPVSDGPKDPSSPEWHGDV